MRRFTLLLFIILAAGLIWAGFNRDRFTKTADTRQYNTRLVIPVSPEGAAPAEAGQNSPVREESQFISFMPLEAGETLIQAVTTDFNGDGLEDQISVVKQGNNPSLTLAVVLYNNRTNGFYRAAQIDTGISETGTFSVNVSDVTGTGTNSLVYTGIAPTGETVLTILYPSWERGNSPSRSSGNNPDNSSMNKPGNNVNDRLSLKPIANIKADGTIFIEETYRSDAYSIGLTSGESFPIWVYTADPAAPSQSLDQIHTLYRWNPQSGMYEKVSETKVAGKKLEATALARIQDGKVETFVSFLNGLWYKLTPAGEPQYLFFNPQEKELVLLVNNTQEIYDWTSSILRRNGIYLGTSNKPITTLKKRFDITLTGLDEIKLKISEDVQMKISADSTWDGDYRKMGRAAIASGENKPLE
ncbi:MAG: pallilysin-related adhesin [Spirochaetaceae bacterium]|jgi:hypothetical protein|nr:pallilysin-related adhesin [Spirochaetaceae bacterium]